MSFDNVDPQGQKKITSRGPGSPASASPVNPLSGFEGINVMLEQQRRHMEQLTEENQLLKQQIAELLAGKGITVVIGNTPFRLLGADAPPPKQEEFQEQPTAGPLADTLLL